VASLEGWSLMPFGHVRTKREPGETLLKWGLAVHWVHPACPPSGRNNVARLRSWLLPEPTRGPPAFQAGAHSH
jgi:hypothetical protein